MIKRVLSLWVLALAFAGPALAAVEGIAEMKITMAGGGSGTGKVYISRLGSRSELQIRAAAVPQTMQMVWLMKASNKDIAYIVNDEKRTYAEMNLKEMSESVKGFKDDATYTVKKLGKESILGYSTDHVLVIKSGDKSETELWLTQEFLGDPAFLRNLSRDRDSGGLFKALRDAGVEGMPLKTISRERGKTEPTVTMEVTRLEKTSVPASKFEIPAGYTKSDSMLGVMAGLSPEQEKQMKDAQEKLKKAMENMTPEQRRQMEELMKKFGQQPPK